MVPVSRNNIKMECVFAGIVFISAYFISSLFNFSEALFSFFSKYEQYNSDEIFIAINITGLVMFIYSAMKISKMSKEIARCIEAEKSIEWISSHDHLTDLPNQKFLDSYISRSAENKKEINYAAFSIEINKFKDISDLLDYENRNEIFKLVGQRLSNIFPGKVYKLRGDEFLILKSNKDKTDLLLLGGRIIRTIGAPININGFTLNIASNVGISRYPEDSADLRQVIQQSTCAMHIAKKAGREEVRAFIPAMQDSLLSMAQLKNDFKNALDRKAFTMYYQPLVELISKKTVGFEALARWEVSPGKFIPPSLFIPLAEELGKIFELTEQLFRQACLEALSWPVDVTLSFNIPPILLCNKQLGPRIMSIMDELGLPADRLEVEITESALFQNANAARYTLKKLRDEGIKIALDDFGTGYSSLSQLCNFPFDKLKIDKSFIDTFQHNGKQEKIVRAIISLAGSLGVKVTAEGIENASQLARLQDLGCDIGQGYLLGMPAPAAVLHYVMPGMRYDFSTKMSEVHNA
ncbi:putative bifunctional diguanylate cyclase/phosphodiesterase [Ewingella americana]|uniref:Phosphodiesterase n=1 Tax=Ewingella americana TaxID=41202 RepID=A0A502GBY9_9GAMM|nr:GGDEF domain-containing phosphodiesterase [Ewingella americana]TPG58860.1 phosphodiesterase [Ewingella americana]